jgi:hypothetical protein
MRSDVTTFIRQCDACARRKAGCRNTAPMGDALESRDFLDLVSLDVVGPLPVTNKGNRYLLTFIDHWTE